MAAIVGLGALALQLIFLAVILGVVGFYTNRIISAWLESRRASQMNQEAVVAAARARAAARRQTSVI